MRRRSEHVTFKRVFRNGVALLKNFAPRVLKKIHFDYCKKEFQHEIYTGYP